MSFLSLWQSLELHVPEIDMCRLTYQFEFDTSSLQGYVPDLACTTNMMQMNDVGWSVGYAQQAKTTKM